MTNQYLGDGICDVDGLQSLGVVDGLGIPTPTCEPSLIDEMRAAALLQKIRHLDGAALGAREAFALGTVAGRARAADCRRRSRRRSAGRLRRARRVEIDPWSPPLNALVYRGEDAWVQATFVARAARLRRRAFGTRAARADEAAAIAKRLSLPLPGI